jgi:hypothetical protein
MVFATAGDVGEVARKQYYKSTNTDAAAGKNEKKSTSMVFATAGDVGEVAEKAVLQKYKY